MSEPAPAERTAAGRAGAPEGAVVAARGLHRKFVDVEGEGSEQVIHVLRGVDFTVGPGETVSIMGPSGAGKSTLLHLLGGLDRPTSGRVHLGGRDLETLDDDEVAGLRNRHVGFVFQFHHLLRDFTALENVMMPPMIGGSPPEEARERARRLLADVGLEGRLGHRPAELSGGEQQRVAVARALVNEPPLLLADEPSGNLDTDTSQRLHDLLFGLVEERDRALVLVTHNRELAERAGRRLELSGGVLAPGEGSAAG